MLIVNKIKIFIQKINSLKSYLLLTNIFLVFFLILLNQMGVISIQLGDFIFFISLVFLLSLYRPSWMVGFFIGTLVLENINLAPKELGIALRPYQILGTLILIALISLSFKRKALFSRLKFIWLDWLVVIFGLTNFLSLFSSWTRESFKIVVVIISFIAFYFLIRIYLKSFNALKRLLPYFFSSSIIILLFGLWQNINFIYNQSGLEVMPGRPNATFTEPDWLGIFIAVFLSVLYASWYFILGVEKPKFNFLKTTKFFLLTGLVLAEIDLILTVSRSAWLGALISFLVFLVLVGISFKTKVFWQTLILFSSLGIFSLVLIMSLHLTNFQLFNRARSVGSGLQKITIACPKKPTQLLAQGLINKMDELKKYHCRYIKLEAIKKEQEAGQFVTEIKRVDPTVNIRSQIYKQSWQEIKKHPFLGIGWGNIGIILGKDKLGNALNSSNIFLEVWLSSGILGIITFLLLIASIFYLSIKKFFLTQKHLQKTLMMFIIISWLAIIIPNLFNSGILLGFWWVWLGVSVSLLAYSSKGTSFF